MKIIISNPPWEVEGYGVRSNSRWPFIRRDKVIPFPIYQAYAAAVLRDSGFEVKAIDAVSEELTIADFVEKVRKEKPDILVLETSTPSIYNDLKIAQCVKDTLKEIKIALIGPHSSYFHKDMLHYDYIDLVLRGEYEYTLLEVAQRYVSGESLHGTKGITFKDADGTIKVEPDRELIGNLDELPFPARDLFNLDYYDKFPGREKGNITMIGGRGCPYLCTFCLWPQVMYGRKPRIRSVEGIINEIQECIEKYGAANIFLDDDIFAINKQRVMLFCNKLLEKNIKISWQCYGRVSIGDVEMFAKMKEAGCEMIRFGIESSNQQILDNIKKGITVEQIRNTFSAAKKAKLKTFGTVTFGLPGETPHTVDETIKFLIELDSDYVQFSIVTPYPGTALFSYLEQNNFLLTRDWSKYDGSCNAVFSYPEISAGDINKAVNKAWRKFYLRPKRILKEIKRIRNFDHIKKIIVGVKTVTRGHF